MSQPCENIDGQCGASWCDCDYQRRKRAGSFAAPSGSASSGDDYIANLTKHWRENAEKLRAREKKYPMDSDEAKRLRSQADMFDHCAHEIETW